MPRDQTMPFFRQCFGPSAHCFIRANKKKRAGREWFGPQRIDRTKAASAQCPCPVREFFIVSTNTTGVVVVNDECSTRASQGSDLIEADTFPCIPGANAETIWFKPIVRISEYQIAVCKASH
jgi:hypothetical protein